MGTVSYDAVGGARTSYGPTPSLATNAVGATEKTFGNRVELEYNFSFDSLPAWSAKNALDALIPVIPAYAVIEDVILLVRTPFAGGTSLEVGTFLASAGTAVDADGLIPAAVGALANIDAAGDALYGTGAQVVRRQVDEGADTGLVAVANTTGAAAVVVGIVAVGTFTAGVGKLVITYVKR